MISSQGCDIYIPPIDYCHHISMAPSHAQCPIEHKLKEKVSGDLGANTARLKV